MQLEKTVFISYRRTNMYMARAVYQYLTSKQYDVFLDFENIDSGAFEQVILNQIAARAHFIIVLTPSALERCHEPSDVLRREIEHAIDLKRNVVPLMFEDFDFGNMHKYLSGKLRMLSQYNGLRVPIDYFDEAMNRMCSRFLNQPLEMILHPPPAADAPIVQRQRESASQQAAVTDAHLSAEGYFETAGGHWEDQDWHAVIAACDQAIALNPDYGDAFVRRSGAKVNLGDHPGALADGERAVELGTSSPYNDAVAHYNRGTARLRMSDSAGAIADYDRAINRYPQYVKAFSGRADSYVDLGQLDRALTDYTAALKMGGEDFGTYNNRGEVYFELQRFTDALQDFKQANDLSPDNTWPIAGLAITNHALGEQKKAEAYWKLLVRLDENYADPEWTGDKLNWREPLIEEARKLVTALNL